jgi:hypothetical protein
MPLIRVPKFKAAEAIRAEKIDAVVAYLAGILNGGLDVDSVEPTSLFEPFQENGALYIMRAHNDGSAETDGIIGVVPSAGLIVAVSLQLNAFGPAARDVVLYKNGLPIGGITPNPTPVVADSPYDHGSILPVSAPVAVVLGDVLQATVQPYPSVANNDWTVSVAVWIPHDLV